MMGMIQSGRTTGQVGGSSSSGGPPPAEDAPYQVNNIISDAELTVLQRRAMASSQTVLDLSVVVSRLERMRLTPEAQWGLRTKVPTAGQWKQAWVLGPSDYAPKVQEIDVDAVDWNDGEETAIA